MCFISLPFISIVKTFILGNKIPPKKTMENMMANKRLKTSANAVIGDQQASPVTHPTSLPLITGHIDKGYTPSPPPVTKLNLNGGQQSTDAHTRRIMNDLKEFYGEDSQQMYAVADEDDVTRIHALIIGPPDTPYQNGFFYFVLNFPTDYPLSPPKVLLQTTGGKTVRFSPSLYDNGHVFMSILNTWSGPVWTPNQTLFSILLSIQSLMNEKPYHNEPGYELNELKDSIAVNTGIAGHRRNVDNDVLNYNDIIAHETLRVAVIGMLDDTWPDTNNMPQKLRDFMTASFIQNYQYFESIIKSRLPMDGQPTIDPFDDYRPQTFQYKDLLTQLEALKTKLEINDDLVNNNIPVKASEDPSVKAYYETANKMIDKGLQEEQSICTDSDMDWMVNSNAEDLDDYNKDNNTDGDNDHNDHQVLEVTNHLIDAIEDIYKT